MWLAFGGNVNGLSGLGSARLDEARAAGTGSGAVAFWRAVIVLESLAWIGNQAALGWVLYRTFVPPGPAAPLVAATTGATAPAGK